MNKIPVGQTINYAYSFAFGHFGGVLGIVWVPLLILCVAGYFLFLPMFMTMMGIAAGAAQGGFVDPTAFAQMIMQFLGSLILFALVALVMGCVVMTGVTRLALGLDKPTAIYFNVGRQVWLLLGAMLLYIVIIIIIEIVFSIVLIAIASVLANMDPRTMGIVTSVLTIAYVVFLLFVVIRLSYFIAPVVVSEDKIDLKRGWDLTRGNVWRIIGIWLATVLPPLIVFYIAVIGLVMALGMPAMTNGGTPGQLPVALMIALVVAYLLFATLMVGMANGAAAFSYKAVAGTPPGAPPATT